MVKKFNELFESKSNDVFNESNYKNTYTVNITILKKHLLKILKEWSELNYNYEPNKKTVEIILNDYYDYVLYPDTDGIIDYLENYLVENGDDYLDNITEIMKDLEPEDYEKKTSIKKFNI